MSDAETLGFSVPGGGPRHGNRRGTSLDGPHSPHNHLAMPVVIVRLPVRGHCQLPAWTRITTAPAGTFSDLAEQMLVGGPEAAGLDTTLSPRGLAAALAEAAVVVVATDPAGRPCGIGGLRQTEVRGHRRWSIPFIVVRPDDRGRGVGMGLVRHLLEEADRLGAATVFAETSTSWPAAAAFWDRVSQRLHAAAQPHADRA